MNFPPRSAIHAITLEHDFVPFHWFFKLFSLCTDMLKLARSLIKKLLFIVDKEHCALQSRWRRALCTRICVCSYIHTRLAKAIVNILFIPRSPALCFQLACCTYTVEMGLRSEKARGKRVHDAWLRLEIAIVAILPVRAQWENFR